MSNTSDLTHIFKLADCPSDDLLISYVQHKLSAEKSRNIEMHLVDCEICSDMVEGLQSGISIDEFKSDLLVINEQVKKQIINPKSAIALPRKNNYYAIAAGLLLLISFGYLMNYLFGESSKSKSIAVIENKKNVEQLIPIKSEQIDSPVGIQKPSTPIYTPASPLKVKPNIEPQIQTLTLSDETDAKKEKTKSIDANLSYGQAVFEKKSAGQASDEISLEKYQMADDENLVVRGGRAEEKSIPINTEAPAAPAAVSTQSTKEATLLNKTTDKFEMNYLQQAKSEFNGAKYDLAKSTLLLLISKDAKNDEANFYMGKTERMLKNYSNSNNYLKLLIEKKKNEFSAEAEWLFALNLVDLKNNNEALNRLKKIASEGGRYAYPAAEMMGEIEK